MRNALPRIKFSQTCVNLGKKHEPFDRIVKCRVGRQILQRLQNSVPRGLR